MAIFWTVEKTLHEALKMLKTRLKLLKTLRKAEFLMSDDSKNGL